LFFKTFLSLIFVFDFIFLCLNSWGLTIIIFFSIFFYDVES
jgi:hypothetical protein